MAPWPASGRDQGHDARIDLHVAGKNLTLWIEAKTSLYPRDARQALWRLKQLRSRMAHGQADNDQAVWLLIANSISPGAKEMLKEERVGYFDSGGSLFLPAEAVYVYIDRPPPKSMERSMRSLFSGRKTQVLHTLLMRRGDWFGVTELAHAAQVSAATASQVARELERSEWLELRGQGPSKERHLRDPAGLLDTWAKQQSVSKPLPMRRYYVPSVRIDELMEKLDQVCTNRDVQYAVTHEAAGQRYAPFLSKVSQVRCRLLAGSSAERAIGDLEARTVNEGANLVIIEAKSPGEFLFRERIESTWLASPVQVYLDLVRSEGRAKELAEHVRRERIRF